ncbi:Fic/DOC family protein [Montanilutibacter psychrotolerans]|uniref:Cell filamentation protein Fic n=1 Tax=Montanilutibacter psychrotolerans TaxID=1327343 RepID=A0A3M8SLL6_9GAMM|nr:Fic family protein [Lysobacter psychrotolerans]RNF82248.1 cell filamentation protein Fic [Lysobacter psychrotolerans]
MTPGRYVVDGSEGAFQPGSRGRVLANRPGIVRVREMQRAETQTLLALTDALLDEVGVAQRFTTNDLRDWHRRWLGGVYPWAGDYRQVNMGKGGFQFASAHLIAGLMTTFQRDVLAECTPCEGMDEASLSAAMARTHAEFILVHPFREGNGRLVRLLNTLMALQAGWPILDFSGIRGRKKQEYIGAIHAAMDRDYQLLETIFAGVLRRTRRTATSSSGGRP